MLAEKLQPEAPKAIVIRHGRTQNHDIFALDVESRMWLRETFAGVRITPRLLLSRDIQQNLEFQLHDFRNQVVMLLAGVSPERLGDAGVSEVRFLNGETDELMDRIPLRPRPGL